MALNTKLVYNYKETDEGLKSKVESLETRLDTLDGDSGDLAGIKQDVEDLQGKVQVAEGYATVEEEIAGAVSALTNTDGTGTIDGKFVTLDTRLSGDEANITALQGKVDTEGTVSDAISTAVSAVSGDLTTLAGRVTDAEGDIDTLEGKVVLDAGYTTVAANIAGKISELTNEDGTGSIDTQLTAIRAEIDGTINTWFLEGEPSLTAKPASDWATAKDKNVHLGDLYYDTETGFCYRFMLDGETYKWELIKDSEVTKALADAAAAKSAADAAQATADAKAMTFVGTVAPAADNLPASEWTTPDDKAKHEGDLYFDTLTGYCYRWQNADGEYGWAQVQDKDIQTALTGVTTATAAASAAQSAADDAQESAYDALAAANTKVAIAQGEDNEGHHLFVDENGNVTAGVAKALYLSDESGEHTYALTIGQLGALIVSEVVDSEWTAVLNAINSGNLDSLEIGMKIPVEFGDEGTVEMVLVAKNADALTAGGTAATTWVAAQCVDGYQKFRENNGDLADYNNSLLKTRIDGLYDKITDTKLKNAIKTVNKTHLAWSSTSDKAEQTISCKMWAPSFSEVFPNTSWWTYEPNGLQYTDYFPDGTNASALRVFPTPTEYASESSPSRPAWLRSGTVNFSDGAYIVFPDGSNVNNGVSYELGVLPGFCL